MVLDQPTNFARGETTSSIASADTTFDVANASTFADPANGEYNLVVWDQTQYPRPTASGASPEIVRVSGRDTTNDTLTVSRGQEGTTAGSFPSGAALIHTQTAKTFGDIDSTFASFWDEQNQELTADINATNGDIDSLSTEELDNVFHASQFDGADGGEQIQNALDKANSEPGTNGVVVGPIGPDTPSSAPESDVWAVSSRIDPTGYDHTHLIGRGRPLLYLDDGTNEDIIRAGLDSTSTQTTGIHIEGVRFHGNKSNNSTFGPRDPDGDGNDEIKGSVAIRPINCDRWTVKNCRFENVQRFGYCAKLTQGPMTVRDCVADGCDDDGFSVSNQYFDTLDPEVASHVFDNIRGVNNGDQGIEIEDGARNCTIINSYFSSNSANGVSTKSHSGEQPVKDVTVENCEFFNHPTDIRFYSSYKGDPVGRTVHDCTIYAQQTNGIATGQSTTSEPLRQVEITDTRVVLDGANRAFRQADSIELEDCTLDLQVDVQSGSPTEFVRITGPAEGVSITVDGRGASNVGWGILLRPQNGAITDFSIGEGTIITDVNKSGVALLGDAYALSDGTIEGITKNNGQDSNVNASSRSGVLINELNTGPDITDVTLIGVHAYDDQGTATQQQGVYCDDCADVTMTDVNLHGNANNDLRAGGTDTKVSGRWSSLFDGGTRTVLNGKGENAGDPSSTGDWNGNGYEGVIVRDTTNNNTYIYNAGAWSQIASA